MLNDHWMCSLNSNPLEQERLASVRRDYNRQQRRATTTNEGVNQLQQQQRRRHQQQTNTTTTNALEDILYHLSLDNPGGEPGDAMNDLLTLASLKSG